MATAIEVNLADVLNRLARGTSLTREEAADALRAVMTGAVSEIQTAALLTALRTKGETIDEIAGFAEVDARPRPAGHAHRGRPTGGRHLRHRR